MGKLALCAVAVLLLWSLGGSAEAAAIYSYDFPGAPTWTDVNKTDPSLSGSDSLMCWAATAANAIAWAGWPGLLSNGTLLTTQDAVYQYFLASWPNHAGSVMYGYEWWFDNVDADPGANPTQAAGFYDSRNLTPCGPGMVCGAYYGTNPPMEANLVTYVTDHRAIEMGIAVPATGTTFAYNHTLTVWGVDAGNNMLWYTDSDDNASQLRSLGYTVDAGGYLDKLLGYSNFYTPSTNADIFELVRLSRNDSGWPPDDTTSDVVPEPASLLLLASGLLGLIARRSLGTRV